MKGLLLFLLVVVVVMGSNPIKREQWYRRDAARLREKLEKVALSEDGDGFNTKPEMFDLFYPSWSCDVDVRFGGVGNGGKFFCDPHKVQYGNCLVYSFGINNFAPYERDVRQYLDCQIEAFDPTPGLNQHFIKNLANRGINFHSIGLMDEDQTLKILDEEVPGMKLESIIKMLGHEKRKIDVLKMDIEQHEWPVLLQFGQVCDRLPPIDRINAELHWWGPRWGRKNDIVDLIQLHFQLEDCGYRLYHAEPHLKRIPQVVQATELAWVHKRILPHSSDVLDPLEPGRPSLRERHSRRDEARK